MASSRAEGLIMNTFIKALAWGGGIYYLLYKTGILSSLTGGLVPTPSGGTTGGSSAGPSATSGGPPAFNSLLSTGSRVLNAAITDYNKGDRANQLTLSNGAPSTTWSAWNYFLAAQTRFSDLPDYQTVTGQPDPNVPMEFGQYWQLISPWLTNNHGLTGLGQLLGLAGAVNSMYAVPRNRFMQANDPRMWGL
jgi:hypothetical protein